MDYQLNIFLDEYAVELKTGPGEGAKLAAHLWFKQTGAQGPAAKGWVPVGDPIRLSISQDRVFFAMGDVYDELSPSAKYKVFFKGATATSPFDQPTTDALADGSAFVPFNQGSMACLAGKTKGVRTTALQLAHPGRFEFSIEVDDGSTVVYYLDPQMIVDP